MHRNQLRSRPSRRATSLRKAVAKGAAAVLAAAFAITGSTPAVAATTQTAICFDGGGVRWTAKATWGSTYSASGVTKVVIDYAGWTTNRAGTVRTDSWVRTYNGAGTLLSTLPWTGPFNYATGKAYKARNPVDPPSAPGVAKVTVTLGVDGDGFGNCTLTFFQPGAAPPPGTSASDKYEADVVIATNQERTELGITALSTQACVNSFANSHAGRMAAERRMYHQDLGPILSTCKLTGVGENVAYGYPSGAAVTAGWMGSSGHRRNILNPDYHLLGVGAAQDADGRWYAAQVFGR